MALLEELVKDFGEEIVKEREPHVIVLNWFGADNDEACTASSTYVENTDEHKTPLCYLRLRRIQSSPVHYLNIRDDPVVTKQYMEKNLVKGEECVDSPREQCVAAFTGVEYFTWLYTACKNEQFKDYFRQSVEQIILDEIPKQEHSMLLNRALQLVGTIGTPDNGFNALYPLLKKYAEQPQGGRPRPVYRTALTAAVRSLERA